MYANVSEGRQAADVAYFVRIRRWLTKASDPEVCRRAYGRVVIGVSKPPLRASHGDRVGGGLTPPSAHRTVRTDHVYGSSKLFSFRQGSLHHASTDLLVEVLPV